MRETQLSADLPEADILVSNDVSRAVPYGWPIACPSCWGTRCRRVVAAAHAGWRGTALQRGSDRGRPTSSGLRLRGRRTLLRPSVPVSAPDAYEVGDAVRQRSSRPDSTRAELDRWFLSRDGERPHLDMWQANTDQLASAGVPTGRIHCLRACTRSHPQWFFSYRGEGERSGRMVAAIRAGSL